MWCSGERALLALTVEVALHDGRAEIAGGAVKRGASGEAGELVDETDPVHAVVFLDECEGREPDAFAGAAECFFEGGIA